MRCLGLVAASCRVVVGVREGVRDRVTVRERERERERVRVRGNEDKNP